ncbi:hypothetical protein GOP47_0025520 [Adiantum capillus-veneris]|uniref:Ku domain-containing protein n=1 Tax=Adiantum capillus-veneris TaxID=13818 RepID=A0A9D4Z471_ADICA|nr:hypothetical protein GOP47_0025520 [Adiantum capillus-veneris]
MKVDAVVLRTKHGPYKSKARVENEALLKRFVKHPQVQLFFVDSPTSLLGAIKPRHVWVYKKVAEERLPTLKKYSDKAPRGAPRVSNEVKMDIEYKSTEVPDKVVPPDQRTKAYRYGLQLVPISNEVEDALKLKTEKGIKLIGFTDATNISRARKHEVDCSHGQAGVVIGVLTPHTSTEENFTDCFYFNKQEELLLPERTLNPVLQRWYQFLHQKHMDPNAEVPSLDDALQPVVEPDQELVSEIESVIKRFNNQFTLKVNEEKGKRSGQFWREKEKVEEDARGEEDSGMTDPVQDFQAMLARGDSDEWVTKAIRQMKKLIVNFLDSAYKGNTYEKSMACLSAMRKGCVEQEEPMEFNDFLRDLANKCRGKRLDDFWDLVRDQRLTLISKEEAPDSDVSEEEALAFISKDGAQETAKEPVQEEEIDEMEELLGAAV